MVCLYARPVPLSFHTFDRTHTQTSTQFTQTHLPLEIYRVAHRCVIENATQNNISLSTPNIRFQNS